MSTLADLERVEREIRVPTYALLSDDLILWADTIAAYIAAQREQAERNRAEYVNTKPTLPEPPKENTNG